MSKKFKNKVHGAVEAVETKVVKPVADKAEEVKKGINWKKVVGIGAGVAGGIAAIGIGVKAYLDHKAAAETDVAIEDDAVETSYEEVQTEDSES